MDDEKLAELRAAVELADKYVGCGDSACMFARPKGMATNGGCQCVGRGNHKPGVPLALAKVYKAAKRLVSE